MPRRQRPRARHPVPRQKLPQYQTWLLGTAPEFDPHRGHDPPAQRWSLLKAPPRPAEATGDTKTPLPLLQRTTRGARSRCGSCTGGSWRASWSTASSSPTWGRPWRAPTGCRRAARGASTAACGPSWPCRTPAPACSSAAAPPPRRQRRRSRFPGRFVHHGTVQLKPVFSASPRLASPHSAYGAGQRAPTGARRRAAASARAGSAAAAAAAARNGAGGRAVSDGAAARRASVPR